MCPPIGLFLAEHGIDPATIRQPADLARLPLMTKANYVQRYPLAELVARRPAGELRHDGAEFRLDRQAATFWPRFVTDELASRPALRAGVPRQLRGR